jgi:hypothetical protein
LLGNLGCGPAIDSLAGDLIEEYHHGRSGGWYWRQVLAGIAASFAQELRRHALLVTRAIVTGWVVMFLFGWLLGDPMFEWLDPAGRLMTPRVYPPMVIGSIGYVVSAWMVARLHRAHRAPVVIAFLACALVLQLPRLCALIVDTVGHPRYLPYLSGHLAGMGLTVFSILLGGLWLPLSARGWRRVASATS